MTFSATAAPLEHDCRARGCGKRIAGALLFCRRHWYLVPLDLRELLWAGYRPPRPMGLGDDGELKDYAFEAIEAVAKGEGRA
jgi:hypothetical protein